MSNATPSIPHSPIAKSKWSLRLRLGAALLFLVAACIAATYAHRLLYVTWPATFVLFIAPSLFVGLRLLLTGFRFTPAGLLLGVTYVAVLQALYTQILSSRVAAERFYELVQQADNEAASQHTTSRFIGIGYGTFGGEPHSFSLAGPGITRPGKKPPPNSSRYVYLVEPTDVDDVKSIRFDAVSAGSRGVVVDSLFEHLEEFHNVSFLSIACNELQTRHLAAFQSLPRLVGVTVRADQMSPESAKLLAGCKVLRELNLSGHCIDDTFLRSLSNVKGVEACQVSWAAQRTPWVQGGFQGEPSSLEIDKHAFTGAGLAEWASAKSITYLSLDSPGLTSLGLESLRKFRAVEKLTLSSDARRAVSLAVVADLPNLRTLRLEGRAFEFSDLAAVGLPPSMHGLTIDVWNGGESDRNLHIPEEAASLFSSIKSLHAIELRGVKITPAIAKALAEAPELHNLSIHDEALSDEVARVLADSVSPMQLSLSIDHLSPKVIDVLLKSPQITGFETNYRSSNHGTLAPEIIAKFTELLSQDLRVGLQVEKRQDEIAISGFSVFKPDSY